eukprot:TRINITY_DN2495_c0_g1_i1.p1 TRINITY_DN2495_c0_g1~~TRINITY_DN2495_c0_g1_i1.p1  ORF type:complete len:228 (-),score=61.08 TRINITY_DN2495_c0_g1_i1:1017-1700(-)
MFEMTTPRHVIIVRYSDERLTLLGCRNMETLCELEPAPIALQNGWRCVPSRPLVELLGTTALQQGSTNAELLPRVMAHAERLDASLQEGFVLRDANFNRVKVKSSEYVRMSWLFPVCPRKRAADTKKLLTVILEGEQSEFLAYCPEFCGDLEMMQKCVDNLCTNVITTYAEFTGGSEDPKVFAMWAQKQSPLLRPLLFSLRRGVHPLQHLSQLPIKRAERIVTEFQD